MELEVEEGGEHSDIEPEGLLCAVVRKHKKSPYFSGKRKRKNQAKNKKKKQPKRLKRSSPYFTPKESPDGKETNSDSVQHLPLVGTGEGVVVTGIEQQCEVKDKKLSDSVIKGEEIQCKNIESVATSVITTASSESCEVKRHRHLLYPDFSPPQSPFGLVQEQLYKEPWKLLVATIFLNKTTGLAAKPILWEFLRLYPTPEATMKASQKELALLFQPLGLHRKRASGIIRFSDEYLHKDWEYPMELYGIGKYGNDSYRIFCTPEWREVRPSDHWLNKYYAWLCEQNNYHPQDWSP